MILNLQVSVGEAIDKLTILDIKLHKIKDERLSEVKKEYMYLFSEVESIVNRNKFYYDLLKDINLKIWEEQDTIRDKMTEESPEQLNKRFIDVHNLNDSRFSIKNKINQKENSEFKEQKGYKLKKAIIEINKGDELLLVGAVRYLSTLYDSVIILYSGDLEIQKYFQDDNSINITTIKPSTNNMDIFIIDSVKITHNLLKDNIVTNENIYTKLGLDPKISSDYFYLP